MRQALAAGAADAYTSDLEDGNGASPSRKRTLAATRLETPPHRHGMLHLHLGDAEDSDEETAQQLVSPISLDRAFSSAADSSDSKSTAEPLLTAPLLSENTAPSDASATETGYMELLQLSRKSTRTSSSDETESEIARSASESPSFATSREAGDSLNPSSIERRIRRRKDTKSPPAGNALIGFSSPLKHRSRITPLTGDEICMDPLQETAVARVAKTYGQSARQHTNANFAIYIIGMKLLHNARYLSEKYPGIDGSITTMASISDINIEIPAAGSPSKVIAASHKKENAARYVQHALAQTAKLPRRSKATRSKFADYRTARHTLTGSASKAVVSSQISTLDSGIANEFVIDIGKYSEIIDNIRTLCQTHEISQAEFANEVLKFLRGAETRPELRTFIYKLVILTLSTEYLRNPSTFVIGVMSYELIAAGRNTFEDMFENTRECILFPMAYGEIVKCARELNIFLNSFMPDDLKRTYVKAKTSLAPKDKTRIPNQLMRLQAETCRKWLAMKDEVTEAEFSIEGRSMQSIYDSIMRHMDLNRYFEQRADPERSV